MKLFKYIERVINDLNIKFEVVEEKVRLYFRLIRVQLSNKPESNPYFRNGLLLADMSWILTLFLMIEALFTMNSLMDIIVQVQIIAIFLYGVALRVIAFKDKETIIVLLNWMKDIYNKKHDSLENEVIKKHFRDGPKYSWCLVKFAKYFCVLAFGLFFFLGTTIKILLARDYSLLVYINYRWLNPTTWWKFLITLTHQVLVGITTLIPFGTMMSLLYLTFLHIILQFNALIELVTKLSKINYNEWVKAVANLIDSLRQALNMLQDVGSVLFYSTEKLIYLTVYSSWLIVKVEKGSIYVALATFTAVIGTFLIVYVNEYIIDKVTISARYCVNVNCKMIN